MSPSPPSPDPVEDDSGHSDLPRPAAGDGDSSGGPSAEQTGRPGSTPWIWSYEGRRLLLARHRWLLFLLPFVVYMVGNSLEPTATADPAEAESEDAATPPADDEAAPGADGQAASTLYPLLYALKIVLTVAAIWFVLPGYREFAFRVGWLAVLVGAVGILVWIGFFKLGLEQRWAPRLGLSWITDRGVRSGFNPLDHWADSPASAWGFLAVRFFGLVLVVPVIEEFFLRGFLMRFFIQAEWWKIPFGTPHVTAIAITTLAAVAMHPAEILAELVWFSLVTLLMLRTRNIWDCVAAHAVTNLLLGVYVVASGTWELM